LTGTVTNPVNPSPTSTAPVYTGPTSTSTGSHRGISLQITANPLSYKDLGQTITYSYIIKNAGTKILDGPFRVTDDRIKVTCPTNNLAGGAQITCTGTHQVTQTDLDAGSITNNAVASGGGYVSPPASMTVYTIPQSGILMLKSADSLTFDHVGQTIHYTYTILNGGNVSLPGPFSVVDDLTSVCCPSGGLLPGVSLVCTRTYIIQQADLDTGSVTNRARASMNSLASNMARATIYSVSSP
jgi:hypothetical protein